MRVVQDSTPKRGYVRRRDELAEEIQEARRDFAAGECRSSTPADILKTILS
jgi:hypothetical protein